MGKLGPQSKGYLTCRQVDNAEPRPVPVHTSIPRLYISDECEMPGNWKGKSPNEFTRKESRKIYTLSSLVQMYLGGLSTSFRVKSPLTPHMR